MTDNNKPKAVTAKPEPAKNETKPPENSERVVYENKEWSVVAVHKNGLSLRADDGSRTWVPKRDYDQLVRPPTENKAKVEAKAKKRAAKLEARKKAKANAEKKS